MNRLTTRIGIAVAGLLVAAAPTTVVAQIKGKESVPGGVEYKPVPSAPTMTPGAPTMTPGAAPVMRAPATAPAPPPAIESPPAAGKASPPAKSSKKKSKRSYGSGRAAPDAAKPGTAPNPTAPGGGDERRPGGVERAPTQPQ